MKILFYIQTCQKYYSTRLKVIQETYLQRIAFPNKILFLSDEDKIHDNFISFPEVGNSYNDSSQKHLNMVKFLYKTYTNFDYYMYADDDTYLFIDRIISNIYSFKEESNFCYCRHGQIYQNREELEIRGNDSEIPILYPSGGSGFIFDNKALMNVGKYLENEANPPVSKYGDIAYGCWFRKANVNLIHSELLKPFPPGNYNHNEKQIKKHLTYHYLTTDDFYYLEKFN